MTRTFCDRCNAEAPVYKTCNPLAEQGPQPSYFADVREANWSDDLDDKYSSDADFWFHVELCRGCRIELARKLVGFMEAHKS